jgi:LysR family transcriptional regulator of gallate degradation
MPDQALAAPQGGPSVQMSWAASRLAANVGHRHLQVLLALAEHGFERPSAAALGISQPALHQTRAQLEHMAGSALFDRARSGLRLNPRGQALWQATRWALAELRQAEEELAALSTGEVRGTVVVGTLPFSTGLFLPRAVEAALSAHPGLQVTVIDGVYDALITQLRHAEIDLIVGALRPAPPSPDLQQDTLFLDQLAVVVRAGHPLLGRQQVRLVDVQQADWIRPMSGSPAEAAFEAAFEAEGLAVPTAMLRVNSALMMEALLAESDRLAMMSSRQMARQVSAGQLAELPIALHHAPRRIGLTTRLDYQPAPAAQTLMQAIRQACVEIEQAPGRSMTSPASGVISKTQTVKGIRNLAPTQRRTQVE